MGKVALSKVTKSSIIVETRLGLLGKQQDNVIGMAEVQQSTPLLFNHVGVKAF